MFFKNATMFRFPSTLDFSQLDAQVKTAPLKPVGPLEMSSRGFIDPIDRKADEPAVRVSEDGLAIWVSVGGQDKLVPGAAVNDLLQKKLDEIEAKEGRRPGGKTRKRLKDDLLHELLPKAFVKPSRTDAIIIPGLGLILVDASSRKTAENIISELRGVMGSFPAMPINAEISPIGVLTGWIAGEPIPEGLSIGTSAVMEDPIDGGAKATLKNQELRSEEVDKHLESGKQVTALELILDDCVQFVFTDALVLKSVKLLEGAVENLETSSADDLMAELDARFHLFTAEMVRVFNTLQPAFKISSVD